MWVLVLLLAVGVSSQPLTCQGFECKPSTVTFNSATCLYGTQNMSYIRPCSTPILKYCQPVTGALNSTCALPPVAQPMYSWPGENCVNDTSCKYGNCWNTTCYGMGYGDTCKDSNWCSPGLYCNSTKQCQFLIFAGSEEGCTSDEMCELNAGCNFGKCVFYFSLGANSQVENCTGSSNFLCENLICFELNATNSYCGSAVTTSMAPGQTLPLSCTSNVDCISTPESNIVSDSYYYNGTCECGYNPTGTAYCRSFPGDPVEAAYINSLKLWYNSTSVIQCNTMRRYTPDSCMQKHWNLSSYNEYVYNHLHYSYFPNLIGVDNCTNKVFFQDYYQALAAYQNNTKNDASTLEWTIIGLVAILAS